jgi:hypothetical protein
VSYHPAHNIPVNQQPLSYNINTYKEQPMSYKQQEVIDRANHILSMPVTLRAGTINEFDLMAEGVNTDIRQQFYAGKPDKFFKEVLAIVNGGE